MAFSIGNPTGPNGAYTRTDLSGLTDEQFRKLDEEDGADGFVSADLAKALDLADGKDDNTVSLDPHDLQDAINQLAEYLAKNGGFAKVTSTEEGRNNLQHALDPRAHAGTQTNTGSNYTVNQTTFKGFGSIFK